MVHFDDLRTIPHAVLFDRIFKLFHYIVETRVESDNRYEVVMRGLSELRT